MRVGRMTFCPTGGYWPSRSVLKLTGKLTHATTIAEERGRPTKTAYMRKTAPFRPNTSRQCATVENSCSQGKNQVLAAKTTGAPMSKPNTTYRTRSPREYCSANRGEVSGRCITRLGSGAKLRPLPGLRGPPSQTIEHQHQNGRADQFFLELL